MPATMAGLSLLLETNTTAKQQQLLLQCAGGGASRTPPPQIISKACILNATTAWSTTSSSASPSSTRSSMALPQVMMTSSFLHRCFLCHRELADGIDIYIYRGDRAFCSDECRCRHILVEEDDDGAMDCAEVTALGRSRRRRQAAAGEFAS